MPTRSKGAGSRPGRRKRYIVSVSVETNMPVPSSSLAGHVRIALEAMPRNLEFKNKRVQRSATIIRVAASRHKVTKVRNPTMDMAVAAARARRKARDENQRSDGLEAAHVDERPASET